MVKFWHSYVSWLLIAALLTRVAIIGWGLPYAANPAHEHSLFYDSRAVIHDQYKVFEVAVRLSKGNAFAPFISESYMPALQRYLAAPIILLGFFIKTGFNVDRVIKMTYLERSFDILLVNRIASLLGSLYLVWWLVWLMRRLVVPGWLTVLVTGLFILNPVEIALAINEKTITLITVVLCVQYWLLWRWQERLQTSERSNFQYMWLAAALIGVAAGTREQGIFFAGALFIIAVTLFIVQQRRWKYLVSAKRIASLIVAPLFGLLVTSPDFIVKWKFWIETLIEPHRPWEIPALGPVVADMWYLFEILFAGSVGSILFLVVWAGLIVAWRRVDVRVRVILLWLPLFVFVQFFYPVKDPRFVQPLTVFGLALIAYAASLVIKKIGLRSRWSYIILGSIALAWAAQSWWWGTSSLAFFQGRDNRLLAADAFHAIAPLGATAAQFYTVIHDREIPLNEQKYHVFAYDNKNNSVYDQAGSTIRQIADWPEYIFIQYETGAIWEPPEQIQSMTWRDMVRDSGEYTLTTFYPKRTWHGGYPGLFGTKSRWAYLNPTVEVYQKIQK